MIAASAPASRVVPDKRPCDEAWADALHRALARPVAFAPHDQPFWDDPHISSEMLAAHLDPERDAASRRPPAIGATVEHLVSAMGLRSGDRLLDLGCGPGLYAAAFAGRGLEVTGIDLSARSIAHATEAAKADHLRIDYREGDYTTADLGGPYDAAVLIYLDFGVLPDAGRDRLLDGLRDALAAGGAFAFDVHGPARRRVVDGGIRVSRHRQGFWRPHPHVLVETTYRFEHRVDVDQYAVIDAAGVTAYRVWDRAYSLRELRRLLARHGFRLDDAWADLTGAPMDRRLPTLAVMARRR